MASADEDLKPKTTESSPNNDKGKEGDQSKKPALPSDNKEMQKQIDELKQEMNKEITNLKAMVESLRKDSSEKESRLKVQKEEIDSLKTSAEKLQKEKDIEIAALNVKLQQLGSENTGLEQHLKNEKDTTTKLQAEIAKLKRRTPTFAVVQTPDEFNKDPQKRINITYRKGKKDQAVNFCRGLALKFQDEDVNTVSRSIEAKFEGVVTQDLLNLLALASVESMFIESVTPEDSEGAIDGVSAAGKCSACGIAPVADQCRILTEKNETFEGFLKSRWALEKINVRHAWKQIEEANIVNDEFSGPEPLIIAVIDNGFDTEHPDLQDVLDNTPGSGFHHNFTKQGDADDVSPRRDSTRQDIRMHGTHVASQIAYICAARTPAFDMFPDLRERIPQKRAMAKLMLLKVTEGNATQLGNAITWAAQHGASIINISMHIKSKKALDRKLCDPVLENAVRAVVGADDDVLQYNEGRGILIVCTPGNLLAGEIGNRDEEPVWPCCLGFDDVIGSGESFPETIPRDRDTILAVTSMQPDPLGGERIVFHSESCFGAKSVDVAAPGGGDDQMAATVTQKDIRVEVIGALADKLEGSEDPCKTAIRACMHGTSQAAPMVAGAAALVWNLPEYRHEPAVRIKEMMTQFVSVSDSLSGVCRTGGSLDLSRLVSSERERRIESLTRPDRGLPTAFWKGYTRLKLGEYSKAVSHLLEAHKESPRLPEISYFTALALSADNQRRRADLYLQAALRLEKDMKERERARGQGDDLLYRNYRRHWYELMEPVQGPVRYSLETARRTYFASGRKTKDWIRPSGEDSYFPIWDLNSTLVSP